MNIILGGTHGLGWELADQLRENDDDTYVIGRSYDEGKHGKGLSIDLSDRDDVNNLINFIDSQNDSFSFYWPAGIGYTGDFAEQEDVQQMVDVNLANVVPVIQKVWQKMLTANEATRLVIVSSTTGFKPRKNEAVYAATKHGQVGFARSLGLESERLKSNIKVSLFMPGGMQTPFWDGGRPALYDEFLDPAKVADRIIEKTGNQTDPFYEEVIERGSL
jgi:short-subunit dehydrogenase